MSTITDISNNINESFPVPGQDNDSQGFRDNFNNTKLALAQADSEISDLQSKVLLKQELGGTAVVNNDLNGSSINNGSYNNFYGISGAADPETNQIYVDQASFVLCELSGNTTYTLRNWPDSDIYGIVRVQFAGPVNAVATPTILTANGGDIIKDVNFPSNFAVTLSKLSSGTNNGGQAELVLANTTDLVVGMVATGTNIPGPNSVPTAPVTTITDISGNTVTLSQNLLDTVTADTPLYFSYPNGRVVEAWTSNGGATVYLRHVGDF